MDKLSFCLAVSVMLLLGCTSSVGDNLINKIQNECSQSKSPCDVFLKDATKFNWDRVYFFPDWTPSESIARVIGFSYNGDDVPDDYSRLIFTFGNKVAYEEDFEHLDYNNTVVYFNQIEDSLSKAKIRYLTPTNAVFSVEIGKAKDACAKCFIYSLRLVRN